MLIHRKYVKLRGKLHKFHYIFYIVSGYCGKWAYVKAMRKESDERILGDSGFLKRVEVNCLIPYKQIVNLL